MPGRVVQLSSHVMPLSICDVRVELCHAVSLPCGVESCFPLLCRGMELTSVWLTKLGSGVRLHEPDLGDYNSDDDPQSLVGKRVSSPFSKGTGGETW